MITTTSPNSPKPGKTRVPVETQSTSRWVVIQGCGFKLQADRDHRAQGYRNFCDSTRSSLSRRANTHHAVARLAANRLTFIKLAAIRIWLRANESTPWICCTRVQCPAFAPALWTTVTTGTVLRASLCVSHAWGLLGSSYGDGKPSRRIGQQDRDCPDVQRYPIRICREIGPWHQGSEIAR